MNVEVFQRTASRVDSQDHTLHNDKSQMNQSLSRVDVVEGDQNAAASRRSCIRSPLNKLGDSAADSELDHFDAKLVDSKSPSPDKHIDLALPAAENIISQNPIKIEDGLGDLTENEDK